MPIEMRGEASVDIAAAPEHVYDLVSDIKRMGEWSPECVRVEWMEGFSSSVEGAQFMGTNRNEDTEWTTPNTILVADPGREFAWCVGGPNFLVTTWRFVFTPKDGGTRVTESFELGDVEMGFAATVLAAPEEERQGLIDERTKKLITDMHETLRRIKKAAEAG